MYKLSGDFNANYAKKTNGAKSLKQNSRSEKTSYGNLLVTKIIITYL